MSHYFNTNAKHMKMLLHHTIIYAAPADSAFSDVTFNLYTGWKKIFRTGSKVNAYLFSYLLALTVNQ